MFEVTVNQQFSAAHYLRDYKGKKEPLHGHNWKVEVCYRGESLGPGGMLVDFLEIKQKLTTALNPLEHSLINDLEAFKAVEPSTENLARYLFEELNSSESFGAYLYQVKVWETDCFSACYRG